MKAYEPCSIVRIAPEIPVSTRLDFIRVPVPHVPGYRVAGATVAIVTPAPGQEREREREREREYGSVFSLPLKTLDDCPFGHHDTEVPRRS
jgi:hypothetical protein